MTELIKIKNVSTRYNITANTLHYYEKMGLIESSRCESSGYRLYDETAIVRLKQILILRKMNISIKNIKEIFNAKNSEVLLSVLIEKADGIDNEVALLHELKEIVLSFIKQVRSIDFYNDMDVKRLYDAAVEIETQLSEADKPLDIKRLAEITDELDTSPDVIDIPKASKAPFTHEIVKSEPYRFIGKAVYVRNDWSTAGKIVQMVWSAKEWIFSTLDKMTEYHTDMPYGGGLYIWDKYEDKNKLIGYIIGKFMKADTPVPKDMDYYDIPAGYIAKGWGGYVEGDIKTVLKHSAEYKDGSSVWGGEVFTDFESLGSGINVDGTAGYFIWAKPRSEEERNKILTERKLADESKLFLTEN